MPINQKLRSKYLKRFELHLIPEHIQILHLCLEKHITLENVPEELQPYFLSLQKEVSQSMLSFKPFAQTV